MTVKLRWKCIAPNPAEKHLKQNDCSIQISIQMMCQMSSVSFRTLLGPGNH